MLTAHYETLNAELGNVSKLQERVLELEIGAKALRVKLDEHDEAASKRETENKGLKGEADKAQALIDSMERKISNMSPLLAFVDELVALSSKADELLAFVDQAVPITERLSQLSKGQSSVSGCFDKLKDSVEVLDKSVAALGLKNSGQEAIFKAIEQDSQEQKEDRDWCKRELRRLATEVNELAPLKRQGTAQLVSASPLESPGSPIQPESQPHEARISLLEKRAASAKKELVNIAGALLRLEAARNSLKTLLPLSDHVQGLIDLLARGDAPPADFMRRVSELEAKETNRAEHTNTIENLKSLLPLVDQADTLVLFAGRFNTYEQLVDQVNGLLPLATHVSELRASTQSITVHLPFIEGLVASNRANSSVQSQSSAPNQLWSPPSERYPTHQIGFSHELQAAPASLLPAPDITSNQGRPAKKRRLEATVESLEIQLDSMRNEIDDVAWNVRALGEQRTGSKRLREPEDELVHTEVVQRSSKRPAEGRGHSKADLNAAVQEVFAGLWQGEDGWIEKLDMELGRLWAKTLRVGGAENAGLVIARTLGEVREDIDTLRLAVEARGSGVVVSGSAMATTSNAAGMEKIGEQLIENMLTEHSRFKDQLREWLDKTMKPITDMLAVVQEVQGKLE
ncbi:hypothetical protein BDV93DRAFT_282106 [Ceratobasidium sp. AG-I]|nr:hypothetical protein BDV93DRAFT_282106 [Ceratobasidium sp. AG-I]